MRRRVSKLALSAAVVVCSAGWNPAYAASKCTLDSVKVGSFCIDTYEASVWRIPNPLDDNKSLVKKVQKGKATAADLAAGGATQLGTASDDYAPCTDNGQNCVNDIYAVSVTGVTPARYITWFQAQQACSNGGKRLPTNAEWQQAVAGTPDGAPCNTGSGSVSSTGAVGCLSSYGANDMVGNAWEWVADWGDRASVATDWTTQTGLPGGDYLTFGGAAQSGFYHIPGALIRGGDFLNGVNPWAGPLAVRTDFGPSDTFSGVGFRCAR